MKPSLVLLTSLGLFGLTEIKSTELQKQEPLSERMMMQF